MPGPALPPFTVADEYSNTKKQSKGYCQVEDIEFHNYSISTPGLSAKIVTVDVFLFHPEIIEHVKNSLVHHWWAA